MACNDPTLPPVSVIIKHSFDLFDASNLVKYKRTIIITGINYINNFIYKPNIEQKETFF